MEDNLSKRVLDVNKGLEENLCNKNKVIEKTQNIKKALSIDNDENLEMIKVLNYISLINKSNKGMNKLF